MSYICNIYILHIHIYICMHVSGGGLLFKVSFLEYPFNWACFFPLFLYCLVYSLLFTFIYLNLRIFKGEHLVLLTYIYLYLNIEN